jgi:hypothetical protein
LELGHWNFSGLAAMLAIFPLIVFVVAATWVFSCPRWEIIVFAD